MKLLLLAALALVASMALVACGGGGIDEASNNDDIGVAEGGDPSGNLNISNWPLYIDGKTISDFDKETGTSTKYTEDVNDNNEFFGKVQPLLSQGESGGRRHRRRHRLDGREDVRPRLHPETRPRQADDRRSTT